MLLRPAAGSSDSAFRDSVSTIVSPPSTKWLGHRSVYIRFGLLSANGKNPRWILGGKKLERATGVEPATSSLGSWHSTAELRPPKGAAAGFL
jgi:hypothetical protein